MTASVQDIIVPPAQLYRIGRTPDPFAWPPLERIGQNRFDDPGRRFRTLYAGEQRMTCFVEVLAPFRTSLEWLTAVNRVRAGDLGDDAPIGGIIPARWLVRRRIGTLSLQSGQRWLDLRSLDTRIALRSELASGLAAGDHADFDLGDAISRNRGLTQMIAGWAYDQGYRGIAYKSRFDCAFDCWAIFDQATIAPAAVAPIADDDSDLNEIADLFDLIVR